MSALALKNLSLPSSSQAAERPALRRCHASCRQVLWIEAFEFNFARPASATRLFSDWDELGRQRQRSITPAVSDVTCCMKIIIVQHTEQLQRSEQERLRLWRRLPQYLRGQRLQGRGRRSNAFCWLSYFRLASQPTAWVFYRGFPFAMKCLPLQDCNCLWASP